MGRKVFFGWMVLGLFLTMSGMANAATQTVTPSVTSFADKTAGDAISFDVAYSTDPSSVSSGLGLNIHWNSSKLTFVSLANPLMTDNLTGGSGTVEDDTADRDGDPTTDKMVAISWASFTGQWPASNTLYTANFTAATGISGSTTIRFSAKNASGASTAATGYTLSATNVTVSAVNQMPAVTNNTGLTGVNEHGSGTFTTAMLQFTDPEGTAAASLTYTLATAPANGSLNKSGMALAASGTFTQADIDGGNITYTHNGSETTSDSFSVTVSDGSASSAATTVTVTVMAVNDDPVLATTTPAALSVPEGSAGTVIGNSILKVTDADHASSAITFTLTTLPTLGTVQKSGTDLALSATFTQAEIDSGAITYKPLSTTLYNETTPPTDTLSVTATDGGSSSPLAATVNITIAPPFGFVASGPIVLLGSGSDTFVLDVSNGTGAAWTQSNSAAGTLSTTTGASATYTAAALTAGAGSVTDTVTVTSGSLTSAITITIHSPLLTGITAATGVTFGSTIFSTGMPAGGSGTLTCAITGTAATASTSTACDVTATASTTGTITVTVTDSATYAGTASKTSGNTATTASIEVVAPITVSSSNPVYLDTDTSKTSQITATGGKGSYTYASSDTSKVTVDSAGMVTAVASGSSTITITDAAYSNITATAVATVLGPMTLKDSSGNAISGTQTTVDGVFKLMVAGGGGAVNQTVTVTGPGSFSQTLTGVSDVYTFTAPTTGAFAGEYTLTVADSRLGTSQTVTVAVPMKISVSSSGLLGNKDPAGTVTVLGAAVGDTITFEVLDSAKAVDTTGKIATVASATATTDGATSNIVTKSVTTTTNFTIKATNTTQASSTNSAYTQVTSKTLSVLALQSYVITVVDSANAVLEGATVTVVRPSVALKALVAVTTNGLSLSATSAVATGATAATANLTLIPGNYTFEVTPVDRTKHQSTRVSLASGTLTKTATLQKIAKAVTYTGTIALTGTFATTAPANIAAVAVDAAGNSVAGSVAAGNNSFTVVVDATAFTPVRFNVTADGAKMASKLAPTTVGTCSNAALLTQTECEAATPAGTWTVSGTFPDAFSLGPVALPPISGTIFDALAVKVVTSTVEKSSMGSAQSVAVGADSQSFSVTDASLTTAAGVKISVPVNAFASADIGDVFASMNVVKVSSTGSTATAYSRAQMTNGEIIEINLVVTKIDGTVQDTGSGNSLITGGVPVEVPVDKSVLFSVMGTEDLTAINNSLVVYTAPSIQDFLDGVNITTVSGATFDPLTSTVTVNMPHFSVIVPGMATSSGSSTSGGGGCFIATAAYGSYEAPYVQLLRQFRDQILLTNTAGSWFVDQYYTYSPAMAEWLRGHDGWRAIVRVLLLPLIALSWLMVQASFLAQILVLVAFGLLPVGLLAWRRRSALHNAKA